MVILALWKPLYCLVLLLLCSDEAETESLKGHYVVLEN